MKALYHVPTTLGSLWKDIRGFDHTSFTSFPNSALLNSHHSTIQFFRGENHIPPLQSIWMEGTGKEGSEIVLGVINVLLAHILKDPNLLKIYTEAPLS